MRIASTATHCGARLLRRGRRLQSSCTGEMAAARVLLGVDAPAAGCIDQTDLRRRYYVLAKQCHPDSAAPALADPARFNMLAEAYALLSGRPTAQQEQPPQSRNSSKSSSGSMWAMLFYGNVAHEVTIDQQTLEELQRAAALKQGGVDRGGMWELARNMSKAKDSSTPTREINALLDSRVDAGDGRPRPFSRTARRPRMTRAASFGNREDDSTHS